MLLDNVVRYALRVIKNAFRISKYQPMTKLGGTLFKHLKADPENVITKWLYFALQHVTANQREEEKEKWRWKKKRLDFRDNKYRSICNCFFTWLNGQTHLVHDIVVVATRFDKKLWSLKVNFRWKRGEKNQLLSFIV